MGRKACRVAETSRTETERRGSTWDRMTGAWELGYNFRTQVAA